MVIEKFLIIENEKNDAERLLGIIKKAYPDMEYLGLYSGVLDAVVALIDKKPDLVFLDIELDDGASGFDILDSVPPDDFGIIYTTYSSDHIKKIFEYNAVDYLIKPYHSKDVLDAIQHATTIYFEIKTNHALLKRNIFEPDPMERLFLIKRQNAVYHFKFKDIIAFIPESNGNGAYVCTITHTLEAGMKTELSLKQIGAAGFLPDSFIVLRGIIVNRNYIIGYSKVPKLIIAINDSFIPISAPDLKRIRELLHW